MSARRGIGGPAGWGSPARGRPTLRTVATPGKARAALARYELAGEGAESRRLALTLSAPARAGREDLGPLGRGSPGPASPRARSAACSRASASRSATRLCISWSLRPVFCPETPRWFPDTAAGRSLIGALRRAARSPVGVSGTTGPRRTHHGPHRSSEQGDHPARCSCQCRSWTS